MPSLELISVFLIASAAVAYGTTTFYGDFVVQTTPTSHDQLNFLKQLERSEDFDFWEHPTTLGKPCELHIRRNQIAKMKTLFSEKNLPFNVEVSDLQSLINKEKSSHSRFSTADPLLSYISQTEIADWLSSTSDRCGRRCTLMNFGTSLEGRDMKLIKIVGNPNSAADKPAVFIDGGIHAREWISPVFVNNMIQKLVDEYAVDSDVTLMLDSFDWYIIPLLNPDGYQHSHDNYRLWRKNRAGNSGHACMGVDLNRNAGYLWGGPGSSGSACSETYRGSSNFSEPETQALRDFLATLPNLRVYLTIHSYGEYILYPWSYDRGYTAPNDADLEDVAVAGWLAIRNAGGGEWTIGPSGTALYPAAGVTMDWAYGARLPETIYSYTIELPPRTSSDGGFVLPDSQIPMVVSTVWPGIKAMVLKVIEKDNAGTSRV